MTDVEPVNIRDSIAVHQGKAEKLFCASVLMSPDMARHDCGWLDPKLFLHPEYRAFWEDVRTGKDATEAAINASIYGDLVFSSPDTFTHSYAGLAHIIADDRYLIDTSAKLTRIAQAIEARQRADVTAMIEDLAKDKPDGDSDIPSVVDVALNLAELVEHDRRAIKTHLIPLDKVLGGFERQTLNILAARPSMGKTSAAFQFARNAALDGNKVLYLSIEMSTYNLWARATCGVLQIEWADVLQKNYDKLPGGNLDAFRSEAVNLAARYGDNLLIDDNSRITIDGIWQRVAQYKPDFLIVDHQDLIEHKEPNPVRRAGAVSWALKQIGKEFDIPVLMLQQLNRGTEEHSRDNRRPTMSDLRGSGELEQNADTILFIYREDYYKRPDEIGRTSETEFIVAKNRMGIRNQAIKVIYHLPRQWFYRLGDTM